MLGRVRPLALSCPWGTGPSTHIAGKGHRRAREPEGYRSIGLVVGWGLVRWLIGGL